MQDLVFTPDYETTSLRDKVFNKKKILIYPNPVRNELNIKSENVFNMLFIFNLEGMLIYEKKFNTYQNAISLNLNLESGFYIIQLVNENVYTFSEFFITTI